METTNEQILQELQKRHSRWNIDKTILSLATAAILALVGFVWDMNVRVSLLEQKLESNVALESVQKLEIKLESLQKEVTDMRIALETLASKNDDTNK